MNSALERAVMDIKRRPLVAAGIAALGSALVLAILGVDFTTLLIVSGGIAALYYYGERHYYGERRDKIAATKNNVFGDNEPWQVISTAGTQAEATRDEASPRNDLADQPLLIIKTYTGTQAEATMRFQADAIEMAAHGYFPTAQTWVPGQWSAGAFIIGFLLCFVLIGVIVLIYMLIVKPHGTLTVTYERRATSVEEKICPKCAERIKAAALVCLTCPGIFGPVIT
jgi:hypothetical protein